MNIDDVFSLIYLAEFLVLLLIPLVVPGPVAAAVLNNAAKKKKLSFLHIVWLLLINGLSLVLMIVTVGHTGFGSGDIALCTTPIAIAASLQILVSSQKEIVEVVSDDLWQRRYYAVGRILIPVLQLLTMLLGLAFNASWE
jgi:hypothetical protein